MANQEQHPFSRESRLESTKGARPGKQALPLATPALQGENPPHEPFSRLVVLSPTKRAHGPLLFWAMRVCPLATIGVGSLPNLGGPGWVPGATSQRLPTVAVFDHFVADRGRHEGDFDYHRPRIVASVVAVAGSPVEVPRKLSLLGSTAFSTWIFPQAFG